MENEHSGAEHPQQNPEPATDAAPEELSADTPAEKMSEDTLAGLSADNIETKIADELAKVVGIDQEVLKAYIAFLGTMPPKAVESVLVSLKTNLDEQVLPLLELMAHDKHARVAELGILQLGKVQTFKAAQLLAEIDETHPDKKLRKAARKSLYKLKSVGIEVETSHKPLLGEPKHQPYKAVISAIDGGGTQLLILSQEMLAGDLHLLQVVTTEDKGIIECYSKRGITKKMFERFPEALARESEGIDPMLTEADYEYTRSLMLDAEAATLDAGEDVPGEYSSIKAFFGLDEAQPVPNPIYTLLDAENLRQQPYFLRTSEELMQHQSFLSWLLPINEMADYADEILEQEDSVLELSPQFQEERKEEVYQKVIDEHFDADTVQRLQRRLEIMAYLFFLREEEENAKRALAATLALPEMSSAALKGHPFLRELIIGSVEVACNVIEDGYNPEDLGREDYMLARDDDGKIVVQIIERT